MCAITGMIPTASSPDDARRIVRDVNTAQRHRGPDGEAYWDDGRVFLGHRRLSIIDLSSCGTQPMLNEDENIALVCNGEIYNFQEIRAGLLRRGHRFRSGTDIEVILHLYEESGDECVRDLVGMFAFALWDARRKHLLLARDRVGEKPLHYALNAAGLMFASEVSALLQAPGVDRSINSDAVAASLIYPNIPAPLTMFSGIRAVPPASRLTFDEGRVRVERYWSVDCSRRRSVSEQDAVEACDEVMSRAVRGALIADVPVGVLLSGGVDSSAIALHASRAGAEVQAFSVGYETAGAPDPDLARARQVAHRLGLSHQEIRFAAAELEALPGIIEHYAQPFNVFPMLYANQLAEGVRRHVTVALGGNGADEAFGGYRGYNRQLALDAFGPIAARVPSWMSRAWPSVAARLARLRASTEFPLEERRGRALDSLAEQTGAALFTPEFAAAAKETRPGAFVSEYARQCSPQDYLDTVMYSDLMVYHQHGTTVITDISGMTHGLEIRAPFLDHRVLEFAFSLPRQLKVRSMLRPNRNKYVLKRAVENGLPHDVLYGRKYGFGYNIRFDELFRGPWAAAVDEFVGRGRYLELGIFSRKGAAWAIASAPAEAWRLLVFSIWAELFLFGCTVDEVRSRVQRLTPGLSSAQQVA